MAAGTWREPDAGDMSERVRGLRSTSDKIRALYRAGYRQADIARHLAISDQFVSNVVRAMKEKGFREEAATPYDAPPAAADAGAPPEVMHVTVGPQGRIVVPAAFREVLGVEEGSVLVLEREGDTIRMMSRDAALRAVQEMVARYVPRDVSLVDELLAERRREAARER